MNRGRGRFVVCACLSLLLGCGARTSTLEDEFGGSNSGGAAGSAPAAGSGQGGSHPTPTAGAPNGGVPSAGAPNGGAGAAGSGNASFGGIGGAPVAGAPNGGGGVGGEAGNIGEICSVLGTNTCAACECKSCAPSLQACFSDLGCTGIFICAQQTGCSGLSCYSPSTCQAVIDQAGGIGSASLMKVFSLLTCSASSQSTCGC